MNAPCSATSTGSASPAPRLRVGAGGVRPVRGRAPERPLDWRCVARHTNSGCRKTYLFAFLDDHSRLLPGYRWGYAEDTVRLAAALRPALASRGVPNAVYVDNGSAYVDTWLLRACAKLGVRLIHSTPGRPEGRGKIERFFRTVREQFLVEITGEPDVVGRHHVTDLAELNRLFAAWVETLYHRTVHSETGQTPLARWQPAGTGRLRAARPGGAHRGVPVGGAPPRDQDRDRVAARQQLRGRPGAGRPESGVGVRPVRPDPHRGPARRARRWGWRSRTTSAGTRIRKPNPKPPAAPPKPSGIDYARLIETAHAAELARGVNYAALTGAGQIPGQLDLLTGEEAQPQ